MLTITQSFLHLPLVHKVTETTNHVIKLHQNFEEKPDKKFLKLFQLFKFIGRISA